MNTTKTITTKLNIKQTISLQSVPNPKLIWNERKEENFLEMCYKKENK